METDYKSYSHAKGMNFWHLEWCPKYRYKCMQKLENRNLVEATIRKVGFKDFQNTYRYIVNQMEHHMVAFA